MKQETWGVLESGALPLEEVLARLTDGAMENPPKRPWEVCAGLGVSYRVLLAWINGDVERQRRFNECLRIRAQLLAEQAIDIADYSKGDVNRDKLRVVTRLKVAGKWDRERYGEKTESKVDVVVPQITFVLSGGSTVEGMVVRKEIEVKEDQMKSDGPAPGFSKAGGAPEFVKDSYSKVVPDPAKGGTSDSSNKSNDADH